MLRSSLSLCARACSAGIVAIALVFTAPAAWANKPSEEFIQERANEVMEIINGSYSAAKKKSEIGDIIDESVDVEDIALFTLGKYRSAASDADIDKYVPAFRDYLVEYYVSQLSTFQGVTLKVTGSKDLGGNKGTVVTSVATTDGPDPTEVNWRVMGDSSIIDVQLEGVWMAQNLREQIVTSLDRNGGNISAAIDVLKDLAH